MADNAIQRRRIFSQILFGSGLITQAVASGVFLTKDYHLAYGFMLASAMFYQLSSLLQLSKHK